MRLSGTKTGSINQYRGLGDQLWDLGGARPSLDLNFAHNKSLVDSTTGSNLVDFTRASSGTYVDSDGLIKTATTNLLLRSEEFNDAVWVNINGTVTRNANATAAPNGTLTADELVFQSADVGIAQNLTILSGVTYTVSIWIKGTAGQTIRFTANSIPVPLGAPSNITLTGEWTRYSFTNVSTGTSASLNLSTFGGATARNIYVWGAQLEQSSTVGEYIPTTSTINSAPRFNHNPTTGESLGLLVEESRTNLVGYSQTLNSAAWLLSGTDATITATTDIAAPDGSMTAWTLTCGSGGFAQIQQVHIGTSGVAYTGSFWIRRRSGTNPVAIRVSENINTTLVGVTSSWQRFNFTATSTSTTIRLGINLLGTTDAVDIWGAQLEAGSFPTSYIPTTDSYVTRAADVASSSGSNFSSWYRQDEGTVFSDSNIFAIGKTQVAWSLEGGTYLTSLRQPHANANQFRAVVGNTFSAAPGTGGILPGVTKAAVAFEGVNGRLQVGASGQDVTGAANSDASSLFVGNLNGGTQLNGTIKRLTYWNSRLPNETLQGITQQ